MTHLRILVSRFLGLFGKARREHELDEEVRSHIEMLTDDNVRKGMSPEQARFAALRSFGGVEQVKELYRDQRGLPWFERLSQDVRFGLRGLRKNPSFTAVAVTILALGIGATTAIFTVINGVLLRPLPYPHPEKLVYVQEILGSYGVNPYAFNTEFVAWRDRSRTLSQVAAYVSAQFNLTGVGEPERVIAGMATSSFFSLLGVRPAAGRTFLPAEDRPGGAPVAILSEAFWKRRYGRDPAVMGKRIILDGNVYTIVGVLPANFVIPDRFKLDYALWVPLVLTAKPSGAVRVVGRLSPTATLATARTELDTIMQSILRRRLPIKKSVVLSPWQEQITEKSRISLLLFLGAVGFLLLIACANVANLLLFRAAARQKEITVRLAVGAGRARIVRQLLTESSLLALIGGLLGLILAQWGKTLLVAFISPNLPALEPIVLDYRVLGFSLALAVVTGLAFGMVPALQASKVSLNEVLKDASRSASQSRSGVFFRNLLIIGETALAMVLLVGAGLLFRSFLHVRGIDMGFKSEHTLSMAIDLSLSKYPTPTVQSRFFQQAMEAIKGLGGVQSVGGSSGAPLGGYSSSVGDFKLEGRQDNIPMARYSMVSPDYFHTMGIPLLQGRNFTDADREGSPGVVLVNESFARRYLPGENCLGRKIESWIHKGDWLTIVGVVGDVRSWAEREPDPEMYVSYLQAGEPHMTVLVRTAGDPMYWAAAIRKQVASVDKDQPPHDVATLDKLETATFTPRRVNLFLLGAFAALGLILAAVGIYGVVSYSVSQRTHEIGVRMALGAERGDVLKVIVWQGLRSVLIGTAIGVAASLALTRFLQTLLFGVKPTDPATFIAVSLILAGVALLATYLPARRATKIDPMVALRYE